MKVMHVVPVLAFLLMAASYPGATVRYVANALRSYGQNCADVAINAPEGSAANMEYLLKTIDISNEDAGFSSSYGQSAQASGLGANTKAVDDSVKLLKRAEIWVTYASASNAFSTSRAVRKYPLDGGTVSCTNTVFTDPDVGVAKSCYVIWRDSAGALKSHKLANETGTFTFPSVCKYPANISGSIIEAANSNNDI